MYWVKQHTSFFWKALSPCLVRFSDSDYSPASFVHWMGKPFQIQRSISPYRPTSCFTSASRGDNQENFFLKWLKFTTYEEEKKKKINWKIYLFLVHHDFYAFSDKYISCVGFFKIFFWPSIISPKLKSVC